MSYLYDSGRNRKGVAGSFARTDGLNMVQKQTGGNASANNLTGRLDQLFTRTDSAGTVSPLSDGIGSINALTDSAGTVQTEHSYEPFGKTTTTAAAKSNPQKFTGRK